MRKTLLLAARWAGSLAVSLFVLALLFRLFTRDEGAGAARLVATIRSVSLPLAGAYVLCQLLQTVLRALRYRLLIPPDAAGAKAPRLLPVLGVTMVRNMLVDLLPARLGELSYLALLNRVAGVRGEACLSSMSISLLLDFLALLIVLALSLAGLGSQRGALTGAMILLGIVVAGGSLALFGGAELAVRIFRRMEARGVRNRPFRRLADFVGRLAADIRAVRRPSVLLHALALSAGVRLFKYGGLYFLFLAVTRALWPGLADASPWAVLICLVAAEGAASLPVPTFMSFGTYEAGGSAALTALGFALEDSVFAVTAMHVISQVVDYGLGGLAMLAITLRTPPREPAPEPVASGLGWRRFVVPAAAVLAVLAALGWTGREMLRLRKLGALRPPATGKAVKDPTGEARLRAAVRPLKGFLVWSSNRYGTHDILLLSLPDLAQRRLTRHPHAETYPRISPDGRTVAFCRSQIPWVSQRDPLPWDVHLLDIATGRERKLIEGGNAPTWSKDGRTVYAQHHGTKFIAVDVETGARTVLFESGRGGIPAGAFLQTPDFNPRNGELAVTLRGAARGTARLGPRGLRMLDDGCQVVWAPDGSFLHEINKGGRGINAVFKMPLQGGAGRRWLDLPAPFSHEYFPRLSQDGQWMVLGAAARGHEHDTADYEIFLWPTAQPSDAAVRVTFHTGNDCWPDLYLEPPKAP